jgi:hypothetical protein
VDAYPGSHAGGRASQGMELVIDADRYRRMRHIGEAGARPRGRSPRVLLVE